MKTPDAALEHHCPTCEQKLAKVQVKITGVCPTHGIVSVVCGDPKCWCAARWRSSLQRRNPMMAPEDAAVVAEVLRRIVEAVGDIPRRADGALNQKDFYNAVEAAHGQARSEAKGDA